MAAPRLLQNFKITLFFSFFLLYCKGGCLDKDLVDMEQKLNRGELSIWGKLLRVPDPSPTSMSI